MLDFECTDVRTTQMLLPLLQDEATTQRSLDLSGVSTLDFGKALSYSIFLHDTISSRYPYHTIYHIPEVHSRIYGLDCSFRYGCVAGSGLNGEILHLHLDSFLYRNCDEARSYICNHVCVVVHAAKAHGLIEDAWTHTKRVYLLTLSV